MKKIKFNVEVLKQQLVLLHVEAGMAWEVGANVENTNDIFVDIRHARGCWCYVLLHVRVLF